MNEQELKEELLSNSKGMVSDNKEHEIQLEMSKLTQAIERVRDLVNKIGDKDVKIDKLNKLLEEQFKLALSSTWLHVGVTITPEYAQELWKRYKEEKGIDKY